MDSREESLGGGDASFEFLHDLRESVSDLGFFFDLRFEIAEDGWVEEAGLGGHCGGFWGRFGVMSLGFR